MQFYSLSFYKNGLKSLYTQPVKSGSAVKHNRMFAHNFVKNGINFRRFLFYKHLSLFDVENDVLVRAEGDAIQKSIETLQAEQRAAQTAQ